LLYQDIMFDIRNTRSDFLYDMKYQ